MFGTPDEYEETNVDSMIPCMYTLEGTEEVNVPELRRVYLQESATGQSCELNAAHQWVKSISDVTGQLRVTWSNDSSDDSV